MITARHFEEHMKEIDMAYNDETVKHMEMLKLMADTLDTLGYSAGTKIYREGSKNSDAAADFLQDDM